MISQDLLDILVCPETKANLSLAEDGLIAELNQKLDKGELVNKAGNKIDAKFEAGLVREDKKVLYRIENDIPIMLIEEGVEL